MCCQYHAVTIIFFTLNTFCFSLNAFTVNKTNILYQYSSLCGPDFYDDSENAWSFPEIPEEYQLCPRCSRNKKCQQSQDCCPDIYVSFPQTECSDLFIYSTTKRENVIKYEIISTCPENTQEDFHEKCVKSYEIKQKTRTPPVTSVSTGLSFKNKFCAACHNISDAVPWQLMINNTCKENLESSTVDEMLKIMVDRKCGSIEFRPFHTMAPRICPNVPRSHILIDTCNVTGTWKRYDKDINFACNTFENDLKFYKNIFCYLCNPPDVLDQTSVIAECNITGKWNHYSKTMVDACYHGDTTVALYPFKNIYCYVCNTDVPVRNSFFLNVVSRSLFQYYVFNISDGYDRYTVNHDTQSCPYNQPRDNEYHKWDMKMNCDSLLPISMLETDPLSTLKRLAIKGNCTVYTSKEENHSNLYDVEWSAVSFVVNQSFTVINWAFLSGNDAVYFVGTDNLAFCYTCRENLCSYLKKHYQFECNPLYSDMKEYRLPLEYLICRCCLAPRTIGGAGAGYGRGKTYWNIFYIDTYSTMSQKCHGNEIFDEKKQKCRKTGCFIGKKINKEICDQYRTPYATFENGFMPLIGYTLPLRIDVKTTNNNSRNSMHDIIVQLQETLNTSTTYNFTDKLCLTMLSNKTKESFIIQIGYEEEFDRKEDERNLLQFISDLMINKTGFKDIDIVYDQITKDFVSPRNNLSECFPGWRPLLSNILICRHVYFYPYEYNEVDGKVKINGFRNIFYFYQYYVDLHNKLWLCMDDYDKLQEEGGSNLVYFVIHVSCNTISIVFLLITLTTYCIFPNLRTVPGKNIMSLSVSLSLHYITFILGMVTLETGVWCTILGVFAHYFLLTSFGCLFVCAWHMFKIFGSGSIASSMAASRNKHVTCWYLAFTYGYALLLIAGNIIISVAITSGTSMGYGDNKCFISFKENVFATLIVPLVILSGSDVILYSITVYRLKQRPVMDRDETIDNKDIWIFIKLFTTTGCSWILLLVNVFVNNHIVTVIISSINSLQGLYIFIAYVFNKRIYNMYISKFWPEKSNKHKRHSPSTSMTSLSRIRTNVLEHSSPCIQKKTIM